MPSDRDSQDIGRTFWQRCHSEEPQACPERREGRTLARSSTCFQFPDQRVIGPAAYAWYLMRWLTQTDRNCTMIDRQGYLNIVLERYRNGRTEAAYTVQLLEGLHSSLDPEAKNQLLNFLWSEVSTDFERAVKGEATGQWIFPVAIPFWARFGNTAVMVKALLGLLVADEPSVAKAWA